jgi:CDP-2,3-bis-(O-geranylgeranyl)-sn-glycerol synthase
LNSALFLIIAMSCAGAIHVLWMWLAPPEMLRQPLDCNLTLRGRRLFGENKRVRGLVVMPLAAGMSFSALGALGSSLPEWLSAGMWPLSPGHYAALGMMAGLACMLAELPNSLLKRQLDVPPGALPGNRTLRVVVLAVDRIDSPVGVMVAVSNFVSVRPITWLWVLLFGSGVHAGFSALLHFLGVKARTF